MRTCPKCKCEKDESRYCTVKKTGKLEYWCRDCKNAQKREKRIEFRKTTPRKIRITSERFTVDGDLICSKCHGCFPPSHYQNGTGSWCRKCRSECEDKRRRSMGVPKKSLSIIEDGRKMCMHCCRFVPVENFYRSIRGSGGVMSYCKPCRRVLFKDKEKARRGTAKWRQVHRAQHLANHRVRMFERRMKVKVQSDGTVTKLFITALYDTPCCYYCNKETPKDQRTADHKVPLSKSGAHSASNLCMACWSCNCSKRDMTEAEFKEVLRNQNVRC